MSARSGFRLALATIAFSICCTAFSQNSGPLDVYVSTSGNDAWSGLLGSPNSNGTDGPKKTIAGGRDALRLIRSNQSPGGTVSPLVVAAGKRRLATRGAVVHVQSGTYDGRTSLVFEQQDSGASRNAPIIYKASEPFSAVLDAGERLSVSKPASQFWSSETRVDPGVRSQVYVADLSSVPDLGTLTFRFTGWNASWDPFTFRESQNFNHAAEIVVDDAPMHLAQWPNPDALDPNGPNGCPRLFGGYNFITGVGPACDYSDPDPNKWTYEFQANFQGMKTPATINAGDDVWLRGSVTGRRYREFWEHVTSLNFGGGKDKGLLRFDPAAPIFPTNGVRRPSMTTFGVTEPGRFTIVNSLYELDQAGEYYIDRSNRRLLMIPPTSFNPGTSTVELTMNQQPVLDVEGGRYITFDGLVIQNGRFMGAYLNGCYEVNLQNSIVRNVGHYGVAIDNSYRTTVSSSVITGTGEGGVDIQSGDRATLTQGGNVVSDSIIKNFGRLLKFYTPGVRLEGCGNAARNNTISDAPGEGVLLRGNLNTVENNSFARLSQEEGDCGVVMSNHNVADHGNAILGNKFQEINLLPYGYWKVVSAVMVDGGGGGLRIEGNAFHNIARAVNLLPACDVTVRNNAFFGSSTYAINPQSTEFIPSADPFEYSNYMRQPWQGSLWRTSFPHLYEWLVSGVSAPMYYTVDNNIFVNCANGVWNKPNWPKVFAVGGSNAGNVGFTQDPFVNSSTGDLTLRPETAIQVPGWQPIDGADVGSRTLNPDIIYAPPATAMSTESGKRKSGPKFGGNQKIQVIRP